MLVEKLQPPHILEPEEKKKVVSLENMFVDVGAKTRKEAEEMGIHLGDPATIHYPFQVMREGYVTGKAFDDRAGCLVAIEALRILSEEQLPYRLVVNFADYMRHRFGLLPECLDMLRCL
ncbi:MAG: putative aminopeptidase YsdC [Dehalococcoidia bacterium]|nr:putative aminopeptidase YsdC [Chloroflexota bacterium]